MSDTCQVCGDVADGGICFSCLSARQDATEAEARRTQERVQAAAHFFNTPAAQRPLGPLSPGSSLGDLLTRIAEGQARTIQTQKGTVEHNTGGQP